MRYIIGGGGTGGHIFPAIAIGKAIIKNDKDAKILFVGALNRMEMEKVPAEGFDIVGLPVAGFSRKNLFKNFGVLWKLFKSLRLSRKIVKDFKPDIAIGVGGYASGPILKEAQRRGLPTLIQEQNSYPGVTNRLLAKKAKVVMVAYENMERFFPDTTVILSGNPIRKEIIEAINLEKKESKERLGFDSSAPLVAAVGGSLGAQTINRAMEASIDSIIENGGAVLWQTGKRYFDDYSHLSAKYPSTKLKIVPFIDKMDTVYAASDLIISRAGACTISELQYLGKPAVLIPSPNVAEDHQTKNALALSANDAAVMVPDARAIEELRELIPSLLSDSDRLNTLSRNAKKMEAKTAEADRAVAEIAHDIITRSRHEK